eukprot:TRINITY_DN4399_c0_g1_i1.p1 TRINITY_DN4399_c0_g1~~TRINITY_DN4399_c0_g1_i1.p1  ORF type:complete len:315 (+),score=80.80 TRINITY_DN4399_c0_g1_i1:275-1219(+)
MSAEILDVKSLLASKKTQIELVEGLDDHQLAQKTFEETILETDLGNLLGNVFRDNKADPKDEDSVKDITREGLQELFNEIFNLPVTRSNKGPLAQLPKPKTPIPREKPVPKPKPETKWQKFAKEKGIQKRKRSQKVWDEERGEYRRRWGYQRVNDNELNWAVEHDAYELNKAGAEDPFIMEKQKKKDRMQKQKVRERANKDRARKQQERASHGLIGITNTSRHVPKDIQRAVDFAQLSTRSMGEFDNLATDEHKVRKKGVKRSATNAGLEKERDVASKIMNKVLKQDKRENTMNVEKAVNQEIAQQQRRKRRKQ